jgi:hypothetical protein
MMGGILLLAGFELMGVLAAWRLFSRCGTLSRVWLGLSLGLVMMMWFPALFAFFFDFTVIAQCLGLALAFVCAAAAWRFAKGPKGEPDVDVPWKLLVALVLPLLLISVYLQYTHTLREVDGALNVGQSTYGDLCLHLGIATGLRNASFPPTYTLIQGVELGYPFLSDALAASMLLFGTGLSAAFVVSGSLMMLLVYAGFVIFAWELTHRKLAVALAFFLLFMNGGLGFLYVFDRVTEDSSMLRAVFEGYYHTPTNMPDLNLRWVNVICDLFIPQRTLLAGWAAVITALYLLSRAMRSGRRSEFIALGVWAGAMPMIHTHSFLALGLISVGAMVPHVIRARGEDRVNALLNFLLYGAVAAVLALPQLLKWTFPQTAEGGSLGVLLNWVNNNGDNTFKDNYFWFWIKNVGIVYLLIVPAALNMGKTARALAFGALTVYCVAEIVQFQPNPYDNNKLFVVAFLTVMPMVGAFLSRIWDRLKGLRCRVYFLALFMLVSTISGAMSIGRETISDYQLFSADEAAAGGYADTQTPRDAVFLTGDQHNDPIAALAGRQIVCGTGSYLYFHGIDYSRQARDVKLMYEQPAENEALFEQYGVDYVYLSSYERGDFAVDTAYFEARGELVFQSGDVYIYKLT